MGTKQMLEAQILSLQQQLAIYNSIPGDTHNLGTVAVFSYSNGSKVYYRKTAEETWKSMQGLILEKALADWIFDARTITPTLYFEVYIMTPAASPIYASA